MLWPADTTVDTTTLYSFGCGLYPQYRFLPSSCIALQGVSAIISAALSMDKSWPGRSASKALVWCLLLFILSYLLFTIELYMKGTSVRNQPLGLLATVREQTPARCC